jgi:hypothetical protein
MLPGSPHSPMHRAAFAAAAIRPLPRDRAAQQAFAPAIPLIVDGILTAPAWVPGVLAAIGLGGLLSSDTPEEDDETKRCREVKDK